MDEKTLGVSAYEHPLVRMVLGDSLHPGGPALSQKLLRFAGLPQGSRVLEAGCGSGTSARMLAQAGLQVVGLDASQDAVDEAQTRTGEQTETAPRFVCAPAIPLPFEDGRFDAVWSECALCLFGDRAAFLSEAHRVLAPGGRLVIADVTLTRPRRAFEGAAGIAACLGGTIPLPRLEEALHAAGFTEVESLPQDESMVAFWQRLNEDLDLHALARDLGPMAEAWGISDAPALLEQVEDAVQSGELGYAFVRARR